MKPNHSSPLTATATLAYWLLLVSGLAALTAVRIDGLETMAPLWLGAVLGTAFGQILAWRRLRIWLVGVMVLNSTWFGALLMMPVWMLLRGLADPWMGVEISVLGFAPAALCGYLALSERGGLLAFWFPAVLWMLAILDRPGGADLADQGSWLLLSALAALFLGFLHAKETRRLALWRRHATVRISPPRSRAVLREAPLRAVAQVGWLAGLGAATLLLTAWIAPHLWHKDKLASQASTPPATTTSTTAGTGEPAQAEGCCPEPTVVAAQRERVREYFPLLHTDERQVAAPAPSNCVACIDGVPTAIPAHGSQGAGIGGGNQVATGDVPTAPGDARAQRQVGTPSHPTPTATVDTPPAPTPTAIASTPASAPAAAPTARPAAPPPAPPRPLVVAQVPTLASSAAPRRGPVVVAVVVREEHPFEWLLTMSLVGLALHLALRPLRRLVTLRHLGRPLWPETVDQRVSNLWELMLVGLRDAGFRTVPGEQPQELARRVGLEGTKTCAAVLERARHGVRVDAADLEAMRAAAESVYRAARGGVGWAARAAAWLRWPLV